MGPSLLSIPIVLRYRLTSRSKFYQTWFLTFQVVIYFLGGCLTSWSRGLHHLVLELGFKNQVISFIFFLLVLASLGLVFFYSVFIILYLTFSSLCQGFHNKKKSFILFYFFSILEYISSIKRKKKKKEKNIKMSLCRICHSTQKGIIWTKQIQKILKFYILVLVVIIAFHMKFKPIYKSFAIVTNVGIITC
jgi:hypothetical protein